MCHRKGERRVIIDEKAPGKKDREGIMERILEDDKQS